MQPSLPPHPPSHSPLFPPTHAHMQMRSKKEAEARRKAELRAQEAREEAELVAYYERQRAQHEGAPRAHAQAAQRAQHDVPAAAGMRSRGVGRRTFSGSAKVRGMGMAPSPAARERGVPPDVVGKAGALSGQKGGASLAAKSEGTNNPQLQQEQEQLLGGALADLGHAEQQASSAGAPAELALPPALVAEVQQLLREVAAERQQLQQFHQQWEERQAAMVARCVCA
jgi:hypothetical protein